MLIFFTGCSRINYIFEQTAGQAALLSSRRKNSAVLNDPSISNEQKEKIRQVQEYKEFFFQYLGKEPKGIYSRTVILKEKAVIHLVVASEYNKVEPIDHCFWFVGCFPYISFFKKKSAIDFKRKLEQQDFYTYIRPVYAYSTIGYFDDPILSSFFHYDEFELAELVFHELFHSIFYIKSKVSLNENLANYFSKKMALEYFKDRSRWLEEKIIQFKKGSIVRTRLVELANIYKKSVQLSPPLSKVIADRRLQEFITQEFRPAIMKVCKEEGLEPCYARERKWNNASLSAFLTYRDHMLSIEKLHHGLGVSLKEFLHYLETYGIDALE